MESKRKRLDGLRSQLDSEVSSFIAHWRELGEYVLPRRPRFFAQDVNKGDRRNSKIIDNTPTLAARTLRSGMMSGITSPARPWFRLTTPDPMLAEVESVKQWLDIVSQRMSTVFLRSNLYNVLPTAYGELGVFATSAIGVEEDLDTVVRFLPFPIGTYRIANDNKLRVGVFSRDFPMTVRQIVEEFGRADSGDIDWSRISNHVRDLFEKGHTETWVEVCHTIEPNPEYNPKRLEAKFKKFSSTYYEKGTQSGGRANYMADQGEKFLRESGYEYFPVLVPRWEVTGEDVYGTNCPGMESLGDNKQLQLGEKRAAQAIEKKVNPPMVASPDMVSSKASILPGDITYTDESKGQKFRPAHEVNLSIVELENKQDQVRRRIQRAFYEDLFLMLASSDRRQITAREIDERHEEKLLALGPVLEQLNQDLLDPLIKIVFQIMLKQSMDAMGNFIEGGYIPQPPEELSGLDLKVEYISIMAQAQKLVGIAGYERLTGFIGQIAAVYPEINDKIIWDQIADEYAEAIGVASSTIRSDEDVEDMRAGRAQAQQAAQQAEMLASGAGAARDLSQTSMEGDNALTRIMDQAKAGSLVEGGL